MEYRLYGAQDAQLSVIGLGGHEYLPNGSSRGFNEDPKEAIRPGYTAEGYGGEPRKKLLAYAFEQGINFLDVTIDPEKEALGRNLKEVPPPFEIFIQTRPEGMGYGYDPGNRKMADLHLLRDEVHRILKLLRRECIEILNIPFLKHAIEQDPEYLDKIGHNIASLKKEGLIRFASADTFSGEATYLDQIRSGHFDSIALNFNMVNDAALARVIPEGGRAEMAVITREAFLKGELFSMAREGGIEDTDRVARLGVKWNVNARGVTSVIVGAHTTDQLKTACDAAAMAVEHQEELLVERIKATESFQKRHGELRKAFLGK